MTFTYRTQPDDPPDVQTIQKQMAIVAWQPGPNRVVEVPAEVLQSFLLIQPSAKFLIDQSSDALTFVCFSSVGQSSTSACKHWYTVQRILLALYMQVLADPDSLWVSVLQLSILLQMVCNPLHSPLGQLGCISFLLAWLPACQVQSSDEASWSGAG